MPEIAVKTSKVSVKTSKFSAKTSILLPAGKNYHPFSMSDYYSHHVLVSTKKGCFFRIKIFNSFLFYISPNQSGPSNHMPPKNALIDDSFFVAGCICKSSIFNTDFLYLVPFRFEE